MSSYAAPFWLSLPDDSPLPEALSQLPRPWITTNGCFDLVHEGHLHYLQAAKALGGSLIVALNSDSSVRRLKGDKRPIVPQGARAAMLAALRCVDAVIGFDSDTPVELLQRLKPDIHVKGGQYTEATLPEAPTLSAMNTRMAFLLMTEGASTTELIERIVSRYGD
jgi:rfaE bifunctional protein nucleotidyltransferase chain/domain